MAMKSLCQKKERNVYKQKIFMYFKEVVGPPEAFPGSQVTWFKLYLFTTHSNLSNAVNLLYYFTEDI